MSYTLRIYTAATRASWNDITADTISEAYANIFLDPAPLPEDHQPQTLDGVNLDYGYALFDDTGICINATDASLANVGLSLTDTVPGL